MRLRHGARLVTPESAHSFESPLRGALLLNPGVVLTFLSHYGSTLLVPTSASSDYEDSFHAYRDAAAPLGLAVPAQIFDVLVEFASSGAGEGSRVASLIGATSSWSTEDEALFHGQLLALAHSPIDVDSTESQARIRESATELLTDGAELLAKQVSGSSDLRDALKEIAAVVHPSVADALREYVARAERDE